MNKISILNTDQTNVIPYIT